MGGRLESLFFIFMQLSAIKSTIKYYLEKYPNSQIEILVGQKDIDGHLKIEYSQNFLSLLKDVNIWHIKQILHSKDYVSDNRNTIYLCYEKQDDIFDCQFCTNCCGEDANFEYNREYDCCEDCVDGVLEAIHNEREHRDSLRGIFFN